MALLSSCLAFLALKHFLKLKENKRIKSNIDALVGQKAIVTKNIKVHGNGLVKVGGEVWTAKSLDNVEIPKNTIVSVVRVTGNRLIVKT